MSLISMTNSECGIEYLVYGQFDVLKASGIGILWDRIGWHGHITSGTQENNSPASLRCPILASLQNPELDLISVMVSVNSSIVHTTDLPQGCQSTQDKLDNPHFKLLDNMLALTLSVQMVGEYSSHIFQQEVLWPIEFHIRDHVADKCTSMQIMRSGDTAEKLRAYLLSSGRRQWFIMEKLWQGGPNHWLSVLDTYTDKSTPHTSIDKVYLTPRRKRGKLFILASSNRVER